MQNLVKLTAEEVATRFVAIEAQKRRSLEKRRLREAQQQSHLNTIAARLQRKISESAGEKTIGA